MTTYGDVPLLDPETGRFPDSFAPPSVKADSEAAQVARDEAVAAKNDAQLDITHDPDIGFFFTQGDANG